MKGTATGIWMNGMMNGVVLVGMKTANVCATHLQIHPQAHFHLKIRKGECEPGDSRHILSEI